VSSKGIRIDSKTARQRLKPRREPYWSKVRKGGYLGYRRLEVDGSWIARWRLPDGGQTYQRLDLDGIAPVDQFDEAQKRAAVWFETQGNAPKAGYTIADCIVDYIRHLTINNGPTSARDAELRLNKHAVPALGAIRLTKLTLQQVTDWRDSLVRVSDDPEDVRKSKDGANRLMNYVRAALNLAYKKDIVGTDKAWRRISAFSDVGEARKIILNDAQISRLIEKTTGGFRELIISALLTGARYGELTGALVRDFDYQSKTIALSGKTGSRTCYLSTEAAEHFRRLAATKLPNALLHVKDDGTQWGKSHQHLPMHEAIRRARLPQGTTFYCLRHTHISRALLKGVNSQVVAENCGTSIRMIEKHYGKFMAADRHAMFDRVNFIGRANEAALLYS